MLAAGGMLPRRTKRNIKEAIVVVVAVGTYEQLNDDVSPT